MTPWMSVVVPVYNEEETVVQVVSALEAWLRERRKPYEILVVDNASEDRTVERLKPLLDSSRVRLLRNDVNRGKGYSVRRGMLEATGSLRLLCDADCVPSLASLTKMVEVTDSADVVVGSRNTQGAKVRRTQPVPRRIASWTFLALCRLTLREPTRDIFCGFKLWRGDAAATIFQLQTLDGWAFDVEVLALARRVGFRIREMGIVWNHREGSRLVMRRVLVPVVLELIRARRNVRRQTRRGDVAVQPLPELLVPEPAESLQSPAPRD